MTPGPMTGDDQQVIRGYHVTAAGHDAAIAGVIVPRVTGEGVLIDNVAVLLAHRGSGPGRALPDLAETQAQRDGFGPTYPDTPEVTKNPALHSTIGYAGYDRRPQQASRRPARDSISREPPSPPASPSRRPQAHRAVIRRARNEDGYIRTGRGPAPVTERDPISGSVPPGSPIIS